MTTPPDPQALLRSTSYLRLLFLAAVVGVPISAAAYGFLALVSYLQRELFTHLPDGLGFHGAPPWWPLPMLVIAGLLVAPVIRYLPGRGGHSPADGFKPHGAPTPAELPGVLLAALGTLIFGVVLGPEAPLIALGGGLAVLAVRFAKRDTPAQAVAVVGSAGSFAAISTLFGSPLPGAFLLMEASGLGGAMLGVVLVPGLLAAGVGALIFVGMDAWTGLGTFSLSIPGLPHFGRPDIAEFGWALVIGVAAALIGTAIRRLAVAARPHVERRLLIALPVVGAIVAGLAIAYAEGTGKGSGDVLFSGQSGLNPLVANAASYSVGTLVLLIACKGLAYSVSLSGFRGGPTFPGIYIGAVGGIAMSHLPGLPMVAGLAMGIGAMSVVMLGLPLTSVLLATLLVLSDGLAVMPLVIVAVVVAYVVAARLRPPETSATQAPTATATPAAVPPQVPGPAPAAESLKRDSRSSGLSRLRYLEPAAAGCAPLRHSPTPAAVADFIRPQCRRASSVGGTSICPIRSRYAVSSAVPATPRPASAMTPPIPIRMAPPTTCPVLIRSLGCDTWLLVIVNRPSRRTHRHIAPRRWYPASPAMSDFRGMDGAEGMLDGAACQLHAKHC